MLPFAALSTSETSVLHSCQTLLDSSVVPQDLFSFMHLAPSRIAEQYGVCLESYLEVTVQSESLRKDACTIVAGRAARGFRFCL